VVEPPRVDLREFFPAVERQDTINSCTAFTAAALLLSEVARSEERAERAARALIAGSS